MGSEISLSKASVSVLESLCEVLKPLGQLDEWDWIEANVELPDRPYSPSSNFSD